MYAALVTSFDSPPRCTTTDVPVPTAEHEVVVEVLAAGLHPRVRSQANGSHYTSSEQLPLVPGIDGVGRLPDGRTVYFVLPDVVIGAMAERTVIDRRRSVVLPDGVDPVVLAAGMNPGMSAWVGLRRRLDFRPGSTVLVLGATGSAGRMAVQVAKDLGAAEVIGAGRNPELLELLPSLGADTAVSLEGDAEDVADRLGQVAADVDVVIDYLWGPPTEAAIPALLTRRSDRSKPLSWLQVGSVAGPTAALPSAAFRSADFRVLGSGQGSVSTAGILAELPELAARIAAGVFTVDPQVVPLSQVEQAWTAPVKPGTRVVVVPGS